MGQRAEIALPGMACVLVLSAALGCRSSTPTLPPAEPTRVVPPGAPFAPRDMALLVEEYAGSMLSGPVVGSVAAVPKDPADALVYRVSVRAVEKYPRLGWPELSTRTRFVAAIDAEHPFLASSPLTIGTVVGTPPATVDLARAIESGEYGEHEQLLEYVGALPEGVSVVLAAVSGAPPLLPFSRTRTIGHGERRLSVRLARRESGLVVGLLVEAKPLLQVPTDGQADVAPKEPETKREFLMLLDAPAVDGGPMMLVLHNVYETRAAAAVISFEVTSAPDPGSPEGAQHRLALEQCLRQIERRQELVAHRTKLLDHDLVRKDTLAKLYGDLTTVPDPRPVLAWVAELVDANLAKNLALTADEALLQAFTASVSEAGGLSIDLQSEDVAWILEQCAFTLLAERTMEADLVPELDALMFLNAGEAARYPRALLLAARSSPSLAAFRTWLVNENRLFLDDTRASSRVRAYDWLSGAGLVPEGYDPLGPEDERRAALVRAASAPEAAGGDDGGKP